MANDMKSVLKGENHHSVIPLWDLEFHPWHKFTERTFKIGVDFQSLTAGEKEKQIETNAEIIAEVANKLHFSAVTVPGGYWETSPGTPAYFWMPSEYRFRQLELIRKALPSDVLTIAVTGGVMAIPDASVYVDFSYKLFDAPEEINESARRMLNNGLGLMKKAKDAGADAVITASDLSDNKGPFFSMEQMERFVLPYLREWVDSARKEGLFSILHTDGNIMPILDVLCDTGVNAIQAIDPVAEMDMAGTIRKCLGRTVLCGNVDCGTLVAGTPDSVYAEAKKLLENCKSFEKWVFGASNAVQNEVPKENYEAMVAAWQEFGRL
jgi:uroporphyrinogen decarboxylase